MWPLGPWLASRTFADAAALAPAAASCLWGAFKGFAQGLCPRRITPVKISEFANVRVIRRIAMLIVISGVDESDERLRRSRPLQIPSKSKIRIVRLRAFALPREIKLESRPLQNFLEAAGAQYGVD